MRVETYDEFINNILNTRGRFACGEEYHERHHIVPKCCGGTNNKDNLIDLFAREHFIAHKLLAEENPDNKKLVYAWWAMSVQTNAYTKERYRITAEEYEVVREACAKILSEDNSGEGNPMYGRRHSEATRMRLSELRKGKNMGENNPHYGKSHSEETRKKISLANSNPSKETREKISQAAKKRFENPAARQKIGQGRIGKYGREKHSRATLVFCVETRRVYQATIIAAEETNTDVTGIRKCCSGERSMAGGYQWKYIYDVTRKNGKTILGAITLGLITEQEVQEQLSSK